MTTLSLVLLGLAMGFLFGWALEKSRVFEPGMMIGQMQLRNFVMLKVFLAAVATSLVVLAVMNGAFDVKLHPKALNLSANVAGGLLLGAGIVIAGACPGTVLAQIGAGYRDAWFTVAGGLAGAMAFGYLQADIKPILLAGGPGKVTFAELTGLPFWALALAVALALVAGLVALEKARPWRNELGQDVDGYVPDDGSGRHAGAPDSVQPAE
ncbi:MAG: YeeE/YedE thiosulfate transporter family protein [Methyloligellaceae bacterium]